MKQRNCIGLVAQGGRDWTGGIEYTKNIIAAVSDYAEGNGSNVEFVAFCDKMQWSQMAAIRNAQLRMAPPLNLGVPRLMLRFARRYSHMNRFVAAYRKLRIGIKVKKFGLRFLYPVHGCANISADTRVAAWIPDLQHRHLASHFADWEIRERENVFQESSRFCSNIVFSSCVAKGDFLDSYPHSQAKCVALPFRVNIPEQEYLQNSEEVVRKYRLPKKFFLCCGQFWSHKNHLLLIQAIAMAKEEIDDIVIVFTGRLHDYRDPHLTEKILAEIAKSNVHMNVRVLGLVPKSDQLQLMRASSAIVQPSLFEGWSTVVEESIAFGKRMVLSDLAVHREQEPERATFFSPHSSVDLAKCLMETWRCDAGDGAIAEQSAKARYREHYLAFGRDFANFAFS